MATLLCRRCFPGFFSELPTGSGDRSIRYNFSQCLVLEYSCIRRFALHLVKLPNVRAPSSVSQHTIYSIGPGQNLLDGIKQIVRGHTLSTENTGGNRLARDGVSAPKLDVKYHRSHRPTASPPKSHIHGRAVATSIKCTIPNAPHRFSNGSDGYTIDLRQQAAGNTARESDKLGADRRVITG
ncbi:hypothetical protein SAMN06264855_102334 [Halorubrum vacuolatum]|uniref:Uncharacterized protein n=1 Tax=Halorubrum vacuolatum TaxID=63740 RepID=A0A238VGH3_HALVU|nr:hypothetical protein SAMN06264855_102334 [Halorubrum vacuolatum]